MVKGKEVGVTKKGEFPTYETLKMLQQGASITEISKYRKVSRKNIYELLSTLKKKGLIRHPKRSLYELTPKGIHTLHSLVALRNNIRQHNLHFKIKILESPRNWDLKRNEFRQLPYYNKSIHLKNNDQDLFNYGKLQIKTTTKSIIIKLPTIYAKNWEEAIIQGMSILEDAIYKIENLFKIVLIKDYKSNITIISQEYAKIQDALARLYKREGNRIYITGEDGKIWMITDFSFSVEELEFIHTEKATDDIDVIAPFFNDLRKYPTTLSNVRNEMNQAKELILGHAQNINKHQKVLDEILTTFKKINERLDKADL